MVDVKKYFTGFKEIQNFLPDDIIVSLGDSFYKVIKLNPQKKEAELLNLVSNKKVISSYNPNTLYKKISDLDEKRQEKLREIFKEQKNIYNNFENKKKTGNPKTV